VAAFPEGLKEAGFLKDRTLQMGGGLRFVTNVNIACSGMLAGVV